MKKNKLKSSKKLNLIKITKKLYSQNKLLLSLQKSAPKKTNFIILKKTISFIKNNSTHYQEHHSMHSSLIRLNLKHLRYLLPITSLFFSAVSLLHTEKPIVFRTLFNTLKKQLCHLKIINRKIKLLDKVKSKSYFALKLLSYLLTSEKFISDRISIFKVAFFSILKKLQLIHTQNIQTSYGKVNASLLKKHKTARWMHKTPFRKWKMLSFSSHYSNKLLKALCLKVYFKFSKIKEIAKQSTGIQNAIKEITFSKIVFEKKKFTKKSSKSKKTLRFVKWRWLNAKRNNSKKLRIFFVKTKKLILKSKRTNRSIRLNRVYGKLFRSLYNSKNRSIKIKFRWKRSFKSKLFITKYQNSRFTPYAILNYFVSNVSLIKSKNKLFGNKLVNNNLIPFKFLMKTVKNSYNKTFSSLITRKNILNGKKLKTINATINTLKETNNQLYAYLLNPLPGKKLNLLYLALYKNNRQLWLQRQLLNKLYSTKVVKMTNLQKQQKSRISFPLNENFKKLVKLNEINTLMSIKRIPFYKRLKMARKVIDVKKFSLDLYNRPSFELTPNIYTKTNNIFLKKKLFGIFNKFSKLYKRKLFKNFGKFNGITRREFRLNTKNLLSEFYLMNLLMKKSFYNLTMTDFNATKPYLKNDNIKPKRVLANILQLFGSRIKNNYTRKNSLLFYKLSRSNFRNTNTIKNLRRRNKSIYYTDLKAKRRNQNKFRLKNNVVKKINSFKKSTSNRLGRFFKQKYQRNIKKQFNQLNVRISSKKRLKNEMRRAHSKILKSFAFSVSISNELSKLSTAQKVSLKAFLLINTKKNQRTTKLYKFQLLRLLSKLNRHNDISSKKDITRLLLGSSKIFPFSKQTGVSNWNFDLSNKKFDHSKWNKKVFLSFKRQNAWIKRYRYKLLNNWKFLFNKRKHKVKKMHTISKLTKLPANKFEIKLRHTYTLLNKNIMPVLPKSLAEINQIAQPLKQKLLISLLSHKKISSILLQALRNRQLKRKYQFTQQRLFLIENCINLETLTLKYLTLIKKYIQLKNKIFLRRYVNTSKKDLLRFKQFCTIPWQQLVTTRNLKNSKILPIKDKNIQYKNGIELKKIIDINKIDTFIFNITDSVQATKKLNISININDKTLFGLHFNPLTKMLTVLFSKKASLDLNKNSIQPSIYKINVKEVKRITFTFKSQSSFLDNIKTHKSNKKVLFYYSAKTAFNCNYVLDPVRILPREIWIKSNSNFWFSNFKDKFVLKQFEQSKGLKNTSFIYSQQSTINNSSLKAKKNIISNYWNNPLINFEKNNNKIWKQNVLKTNLNQNPAITNIYKASLGTKFNLNNKFGWIYNKIFLYNKNKLTKLKNLTTKQKKNRFKKFQNFTKRKNFVSQALFFNSEDYIKNDLLANKSYKSYIDQYYIKNPFKSKVLKNSIKLQKSYINKNAFLSKIRKVKGRSRVRKLHYKSKMFKLMRLPFRWKKKKKLKLKLIRRFKSKKTKFSFFKRLHRIQINIKNIEKNSYIWQTIYFWRVLIEFLNFLPTSFSKFMRSLNSEFSANLFPTTRFNIVKINKKNVYAKTNAKENNFGYNIPEFITKQLYKKTILNKISLFNNSKFKKPLLVQTPMIKRFFNTLTNTDRNESPKFQNKKMIKHITNTELKETKYKYICEKYDNNLTKINQQSLIHYKESKFPKLFYWRILAPKFNMLQQKKQRIAKLKYFNSKLKKFRWKKKKKKSLSLFFKFLSTWKRLYLFFKGKKKLEKFLPFIDGDIKIKSLKKFYSMRFIIRRYFRIHFFGNVKKNKTIKIYNSVKRLQTNRFLKYCSKLRRYLIPALISMQLAQNAKMALNLVKHGYVFVNGNKITKINFMIKPLDLIMIFIPHSSHPYYLQNHHYFAKNLNSNIARVNAVQRPTNFINGAVFPSRFFLINLKLEDWFKFMHFWTAFNSIKTSFYHLSRFENTNRLFRWKKKGFYSKPAFLKKGRKNTRKAMYPRLLKKRAHIALTEKLWFLKKSAINRFWNRLLKRLVFFSNCYVIFGFYFEDFNLTNKKNLKKMYRNNVTNLTMHILKQYR